MSPSIGHHPPGPRAARAGPPSAEGGRWCFLLTLLVFSPAAAQAPDSLAVRPDTAAVALVAPERPEPGQPVTPVPALTPVLDVAALLGDVPGAFAYHLGAPGWPHGLALDGRPPEAHALALDGRPYDDLFTGRPRGDLLPLEVLGRLRLAATRYGRPGAVAATVRPFRAAAPVTELRYLPGQEGIQYVSAAHAQTRRPPGFLRGAAGQGRLTVLGYVAGRRARPGPRHPHPPRPRRRADGAPREPEPRRPRRPRPRRPRLLDGLRPGPGRRPRPAGRAAGGAERPRPRAPRARLRRGAAHGRGVL